MKKLITLLLVLTGMVSTASAEDDIYLRTGFRGLDQWNSDVADNKFTFVETNSSGEDVYTLTINASDIATSDVWFRLHISGWGAQICPFTDNGSYTYAFNNGQNETYGAKYEKTYFQGSNYSFGISHSTIKANQYKITLFRGNNFVDYENENCKVMWIKVEIVDMPVTLSATKGTFSCDRALDFTGKGVSAYMITGASNGVLTLSEAMTIVPANTGLYLEGSAGTINVPVVTTSEASEVSTSGNMLKPGTGAAVAATETIESVGYTNFILTNKTTTSDSAPLKFYKANNNVVPAGKAYLQIRSSIAGARESFWFNEDVTAIDAHKQTTNTNGEFFNLAGQRVAQPTKGLYIVNGKKVIIK